jgi:hypothetical protein
MGSRVMAAPDLVMIPQLSGSPGVGLLDLSDVRLALGIEQDRVRAGRDNRTALVRKNARRNPDRRATTRNRNRLTRNTLILRGATRI